MRKEVMSLEKEQIAKENGVDSQNISSSCRFSSILASKDRDFLLSPDENQVKVSDLEGKVLGLYFSANWYPPCRNFTQVLISAYEQLKINGCNFEVAFVSSDEDLEAFNDYRASMPWLSIPFSDLETKKALDRKFNIEGIPCLIILQPKDNKDEATLHHGVELLYRFGVKAFPFTKERLQELELEEKEKHDTQTLTNLLTNHHRDFLFAHSAPKQFCPLISLSYQLPLTGDEVASHRQMCQIRSKEVTRVWMVPVDSLVGKTIGLFFSAQWCRPGVKFAPKLISIYHKIKQIVKQKDDEDFEIVFVSSDREEEEFDSYFNSMPWLALPFGDPMVKTLAKHFDVQGIPCLIILGPNGKTITKNGRNLINLYQENAYPFTEARVDLLEKQMDEAAKSLPRSEHHQGHKHGLNLVSEGSGGGPFICCDCDEQGSGWAYQCLECGYEVHPKCVRAVDRDFMLER